MNAVTSDSQTHKSSMDRMYRLQRHVYDLTRAYYLLGRDQLLDDLKPKPGSKVLEIGCGTGRNLIKAADHYPSAQFYGVDISDEMLKTATQKVSEHKLHSHVFLFQADATALASHPTLALHRFDRIYFSYTLSMIPEWQAALVAATSLLSPQGELHVVDFGPGTGLPKLFNRALRKWLAAFGVTPRDTMQDVIRRSDLPRHFTPEIKLLFGGYAIQFKLVRRHTTDI